MGIVTNKSEIFDRLEQNRNAMSALGVKRFGLFGSFLRGEQDTESDVDLLVEFRPGEKSFDSFMNLAFLLEDILGRKVDLITPESLSPHLGPKILTEVEYGLID
jgi:uncharacterized protein